MFFCTWRSASRFCVTDFPLCILVSGSFVSALVPLRNNDLPRVVPVFGKGQGFGEELTEIGEELTEIGGGDDATE